MLAHEKRRHLMIETQLRTNKVTDPDLLEAFRQIPRELFVGEERAELAYVDEDIDIDGGRFLLEPMVFGRLVQALELKPADSVLDIGAASGYSTAVLAQLVQSVVGIEKSDTVVKTAIANLAKVDIDNAVVLTGPLADGFPPEAPYSAVIIEGAVEEVPESLLDQLGDDGRLVTVLKSPGEAQGRAVKFVRAGKGFGHSVLFDANTNPLDDFARRRKFEFAS